MTCLFIEGFDKYGSPSVVNTRLQTLMSGEWTTTTGANAIVASLSTYGQSLQLAGNAFIARSVGNQSRLITGFRFSWTGSVLYLTYFDTSTAQVTVLINSVGLIEVRSGNNAGTLRGTSVVGVSTNATHYLEFTSNFDNSGSYNVYLDGVSVLSGTADTLQSANATANSVVFGASGAVNPSIDDIYVFNDSGSTCNAALNTNPIVDTQLPNSDSSVAFTATASFLGAAESQTNSTTTPGANKLYLRTSTPGANMTLQKVTILPSTTSAGAKFKAVLYSDSAGAPNTLIATGTEVVGATAATYLDLPFSSGQALTSGTPYWFGFITDTAVSLHQSTTGTTRDIASNTYGSGAPSPAPAMTGNQANGLIYGQCSSPAANWVCVDQNPPGPVDQTYVSSSNVSDEDLYGFPNLNISASNVYIVAVKFYGKDSDSGARTVTSQAKSSGTDGASSSYTPSTSYGWNSGYYELDPHTSAAWLSSAVNSATFGYKIAS
jgi:hypothetical protein